MPTKAAELAKSLLAVLESQTPAQDSGQVAIMPPAPTPTSTVITSAFSDRLLASSSGMLTVTVTATSTQPTASAAVVTPVQASSFSRDLNFGFGILLMFVILCGLLTILRVGQLQLQSQVDALAKKGPEEEVAADCDVEAAVEQNEGGDGMEGGTGDSDLPELDPEQAAFSLLPPPVVLVKDPARLWQKQATKKKRRRSFLWDYETALNHDMELCDRAAHAAKAKRHALLASGASPQEDSIEMDTLPPPAARTKDDARKCSRHVGESSSSSAVVGSMQERRLQALKSQDTPYESDSL